jgi:hypothetical protein
MGRERVRGHAGAGRSAHGTIARTLTVGSDPQGVAVVDGALWVSARGASTAHRGGTIRVVTSEKLGPRDLDPAIAYCLPAIGLLTDTNDGPVAYRRVGGSEGARIVPDLAIFGAAAYRRRAHLHLPVRRGIEYSSGATVRASDSGAGSSVRSAWSGRTPSPSSTTRSWERRSARHDLTRGIVVDDAAGTIACHLRTPDPDFLIKLALPFADAVPAGVPSGVSSRFVPATGPYVVVRQSGQALDLARNPHFRVWS